MTEIHSFLQEKGGVGKTTKSVHYSQGLHLRGIDVALVDTDKARGSSIWLEDAGVNFPVYHFLTEDEILNEVPKLQNEIIVIDGPAGLNQATRASMLLSDLVLMPCGASILDVRAGMEGLNGLKQARTILKNGKPDALFLPNMISKRALLSKDLLDVADSLDIEVAPPVRHLQAFPKAAQEGCFVWDLDPKEGGKATDDLNRLFNFILNYVSKKQ